MDILLLWYMVIWITSIWWYRYNISYIYHISKISEHFHWLVSNLQLPGGHWIELDPVFHKAGWLCEPYHRLRMAGVFTCLYQIFEALNFDPDPFCKIYSKLTKVIFCRFQETYFSIFFLAVSATGWTLWCLWCRGLGSRLIEGPGFGKATSGE